MPYADNKGIKIYYEVYGEGFPVVLIHGNPADHWLWLYQIPELAHHYKVIAVDLRAYGRSDKPTKPCTVGDLSADLLAVFKREGLDEWVICGLSIGAFIAIDFTLQHADKVVAAVLVGAGSSGDKVARFMDQRIKGFTEKGVRGYLPEYFPDLFSAEFLGSPNGQMLTSRYINNADTIDPNAAARMYEALKAYESEARLPEITAPTLIIAGEQDMAKAMCAEIHRMIDGSQFHVIPGASHCCCIDSPVAFNQILLPFLSKVVSPNS